MKFNKSHKFKLLITDFSPLACIAKLTAQGLVVKQKQNFCDVISDNNNLEEYTGLSMSPERPPSGERIVIPISWPSPPLLGRT